MPHVGSTHIWLAKASHVVLHHSRGQGGTIPPYIQVEENQIFGGNNTNKYPKDLVQRFLEATDFCRTQQCCQGSLKPHWTKALSTDPKLSKCHFIYNYRCACTEFQIVITLTVAFTLDVFLFKGLVITVRTNIILKKVFEVKKEVFLCLRRLGALG